jgi:hypothetical protein
VKVVERYFYVTYMNLVKFCLYMDLLDYEARVGSIIHSRALGRGRLRLTGAEQFEDTKP